MAVRRVKFTFPEEQIREPLIYNLGHEFHVITNVRMADVDEKTGWVLLELEGESAEIERSLAWAQSKGVRIDPATLQSGQHCVTALQRHFALGRAAPKQYRYFSEICRTRGERQYLRANTARATAARFFRHHALHPTHKRIVSARLILNICHSTPSESDTTSPTIRTSGSSKTPCCSRTVACTTWIKFSISAAVALPKLMMKLACFADTCAPPQTWPLSPHASIKRAA